MSDRVNQPSCNAHALQEALRAQLNQTSRFGHEGKPFSGGMAGLLHPEGNAAYARPVDLTLAWSPPTILDTQTGCHRVATQADVDRLAKENRQLSGAVEKIRRALFPGDCAKRSA